MHFALLTDFTDADAETVDGDAALLSAARARVASLNDRHGQAQRFWLLHRRRVYNPGELRFMGWERKRGKLEELNRLLSGEGETTFAVVSAPPEVIAGIRYVITLDADTELPRDVARKLVGALAHPLNRPELDASGRRVVRGHAIIQPRVGTLPVSSRKSRYAAIAAGPSGLDPYTSAVSDAYQDLFATGSFVGKGIYDVAAFQRVLEGRIPDNQLLSHDLFEGLFARSALATDIEVLDEQPASYAVQIGRHHRWVRGDWQLLPWLLPRVPGKAGSQPNDLSLVDYWKVVDNLRRSLLGPALVALCVLGWLFEPRLGSDVFAIVAALFVVPLCARLVLSLVRAADTTQPPAGSLGGDLHANAPQVALSFLFAFDQAWVSMDAIARTLYRLCVSRKHLLEWTAMRQFARQNSTSQVPRRMWFSGGACLAALLGVALGRPEVLLYAGPLLAIWAAAPLAAGWLAGPPRKPRAHAALPAADRQLLHATALKTWRFFDTFVGEADNYLPPDNFQEVPRGVVAHRTSPTNMGLYLLSVVAARDFSFIGLRETVRRLGQTLGTLERLEKHEGHILNWYDTTSLAPLEPRYVSTVDSGNFAAYLWTLEQASLELTQAQLLGTQVIEAALLGVQIARDEQAASAEAGSAGLGELAARLTSIQRDSKGHPGVPDLREAHAAVLRARSGEACRGLSESALDWLSRAERMLGGALDELTAICPFLDAPILSARLFVRPELSAEVSALKSALGLPMSLSALMQLGPRIAEHVGRIELILQSFGLSKEELQLAERELDSLTALVERAANVAEELSVALEEMGQRAARLAAGMNFAFLFDDERELFTIGYNVSLARADASHYDLLASEARLASLLCIARGEAPQAHWFRLGRPRARLAGSPALLSWSGSMFEYLMPLLVMRDNPGTLLHESYEAAIERQRRYAAERGVPWGVSESAYNVMDLRMTYQYRAFGVPGLGLKAGLGESLVVAPYATVLAGLVRPDLVASNLRLLRDQGLEGPYGFYESIDYTPDHVPPGRHGIVVKAFMAHHQGMSLVALGEILNESPMRRRFHADPRIKATELLLEERVPVRTTPIKQAAAEMPSPVRAESAVDVVDHVGPVAAGPTRVHLLGHGELACLVSSTGVGVTLWKGLDVNRFRQDTSLDAGGIYIYVRNSSDQQTWSAAYQPTRVQPDFYNAAFSIDRVEFNRRDGAVQTVTEIAPSPEHAAEIRRITLTNHSSEPLQIDVTTYTEIVLASHGADVAHRAFGSMFIETEALPERGALLARRRPRTHDETEVWMVQVLVPASEDWSALDYDTSRLHFIGRGRSPSEPLALSEDRRLSQRTGNVLDPALVLQRRIELLPGKPARLTLVTGLGSSREEVLGLVDVYSASNSVARALELGWAGVRVELRHLGISSNDVQRFQRLLSAVVFPHPALRAPAAPAEGVNAGISALWSHGISGDLPIVTCRIDHQDFEELCRDLLLAREFWRLNGFASDLVILNEEPSGYLQPIQDTIVDLMRQSAQVPPGGGVFVCRADQMSVEERELIVCSSRVVLRASQGSLGRQLRRALGSRALPPALVPRRPMTLEAVPAPLPRPELAFDNGHGGFEREGQRYVIPFEHEKPTPAPWSNVIANQHFGTLVTEAGSSFTWWQNSQRYRLTPWSNDAVCDPSGEVIYIRDDDDGSFWSSTPAPAGAGASFRCTHTQGYSSFEHTRRSIQHELTLFVSADDPVKCLRLRLGNRGRQVRHLSVFGVVDWVLGPSRETTRVSVSTVYRHEARAIIARNALSLFPASRAFFAATRTVESATTDREEFYGADGSARAPDALGRVILGGRSGAGFDPCAALQVRVNLEPGETVELSFVLGSADSLADTLLLLEKYGRAGAVNRAFEDSQRKWAGILSAVQVRTPDAAVDALLNHWLLYQTLSSRIWARTGFYQSSGAYGFRDQLQDVLGLLHCRPDLTREHLLRAAARQFEEGDVQHWWHAETGQGLRTQCSDDLAWLPYAVAEYVRATGDRSVLDEAIPFLTERVLEPGEGDRFGAPRLSEERASLYEHCVRALDAALTAGPHGLPTMRGGDWNDGMNRVGDAGAGESVWLAWFLAKTLRDFAPLASVRGDAARVAWCNQGAARLARAVDDHAWDGEWYRRAYFDDGTPLGSKQNSECRIDAIAQSWAVIAGLGDPKRAAKALSSSESWLIDDSLALMRLLDPPFEGTKPDPGYIQAYPPGVRENGGQYTHGVLWTLLALALQKEGDRAGALLNQLNPIRHSSDPDSALRYRVEPYVVAADVYSAEPHAGRGGWTWYTGSAGWMYRIVLEYILGIRRSADVLTITPVIPRHWHGFEVVYRHRSSSYEIAVENPEQVCDSVARVELDGRVVADGRIRLLDDGQVHHVRVELGRAAAESTRLRRAEGK